MLTADQLRQLTPFLGPIARRVNAEAALKAGDIQNLLGNCDLQQNKDAITELNTWDRILRRLHNNPTLAQRHDAQQALQAHGLPLAHAVLAVDTAAAS